MKETKPNCTKLHGAAGFTLLELCIVVFIMVLMLGIAAFSFQGMDGEQTMRRPASELQALAKEAIRRAGLYEQPQIIVFDKTGFVMRYRSDADFDPKTETRQEWEHVVKVPERMHILIKHWDSTRWLPAAGERWIISAGGFCEQLQVRFELGESFLQMEFDPLSGSAKDESMRIADS